MQRCGRYGRSDGELDVFGATRYFDGVADLAAGPFTVREPEDLMIQVKVTHGMERYRSIHELGLGAKSKSNLATFSGSLLSPAASFPTNPLAKSFRVNHPASSSTTSTTPGGHDKPPKLSSSSSRGSSDTAIVAAVYGHDLGEVVAVRRLHGVRVVRGAGGGEETWVVRCCGRALEEEHHVHEKIVDATSGDHHQVVDGVEDGNDCGSDSDTSSDLFELDLKDIMYLHD